MKGRKPAAPELSGAFRSREEAREVIERTLEAVEADPVLGPMLHAASLREELRLPDLGITVGITASDGSRCLAWSFARSAGPAPRLSLTMDSAVANAVLQGAESIGVAIARGRMSIEGSAGAAMVHLPALRLMRDHYLRLIERDFPHLVVGPRRALDKEAAAT